MKQAAANPSRRAMALKTAQTPHRSEGAPLKGAPVPARKPAFSHLADGSPMLARMSALSRMADASLVVQGLSDMSRAAQDSPIQRKFATPGIDESLRANEIDGSDIDLLKTSEVVFGTLEEARRYLDAVATLQPAIQRAMGGAKNPKTALMTALSDKFGAENLVAATLDRVVIKSVLEAISQGSGFADRGAVIKPAKPSGRDKRNIRNLDNWSLRHYTAKHSVHPESNAIGPPPYTEILSALTLAARTHGEAKAEDEGTADKTGADKSGHTTDVDWSVIGNVGDTFYALCYKGQPVVKAQFLADAKFYAEWPLSSINEIWASQDWLSIAKNDKAKVSASIYEGAPEDVLAAFFGYQSGTMGEEGYELPTPTGSFLGLDNFEAKVHGALTVHEWHSVT